MLTKKDRRKAKNRQKFWNIFGWKGKGVNFFSKNHSLNCGCLMCKYKTYYRRYENKSERLKNRRDIKKMDYE